MVVAVPVNVACDAVEVALAYFKVVCGERAKIAILITLDKTKLNTSVPLNVLFHSIAVAVNLDWIPVFLGETVTVVNKCRPA